MMTKPLLDENTSSQENEPRTETLENALADFAAAEKSAESYHRVYCIRWYILAVFG